MNTSMRELPLVVLAILAIGCLLSVVLSIILIRLYKRDLLKGMGYSDIGKLKKPEVELPNSNIALDANFKIVPIAELQSAPSGIYFKIRETLGFHWFVYIAMCLAFSLVISLSNIIGSSDYGYGYFFFFITISVFPIVPISMILLTSGWKDNLIIAALFSFIFLTLCFLSTNGLFPIQVAILIFGIFNIIPGFFILLLRSPGIKTLGLFTFSFVLFCIFGPSLAAYILHTYPQVLHKIGLGFLDFLKPNLIPLSILIVFVLGFAFLTAVLIYNRIKTVYLKKWVNDMQLNADACIIICSITYSVFVAYQNPANVLFSLMAFPAYKLTGYLLFYLLRKRKVVSTSPRLLYLRVFALGAESRSLFERILKHWRYVGSIQMISGPDLATTTVEPHEIITYVTGQLNNSFCSDQDSIDRKIKQADTLPDLDGTHRVNEFFCRDNNWKEALLELTQNSEIILMDLRSFQQVHKGCCYEIETLIQHVALEKIIFLVDGYTDMDFTKQVFGKTFETLSKTNLVHKLTFYKIRNQTMSDLDRLMNLLCSKV